MLGAICGDIIGSVYELNNKKSKDIPFFAPGTCFTDDSVMTCAIANACCDYLGNKDMEYFESRCIHHMRYLGRKYIYAGYGGAFKKWLLSNHFKPYNSFGNGSAMRVSPVAYIADSLEETEKLAEISAAITHNHPLGIQGAKAVASCIWLLRSGESKDVVRKYIVDNYYNLNFTLDEVRTDNEFDVSCQVTVPQAMVSFFDSNSYEDAIRNAISIGGDSDTIAAIAGGIAEAYYGVPEDIKNISVRYLEKDLALSVNRFYSKLNEKENFCSSELSEMFNDRLMLESLDNSSHK